MGDERLRQLERSGEPIARAQALLERVRLGRLTRERLEWAARLGHEEALAAIGKLERPAIDWSDWSDREFAIRSVAEAVAGLGWRRVVVSFALECAERAFPVLDSRGPGDAGPRKAIEAVRAWLAGERSERELVTAAIRAERALEQQRLGRLRRLDENERESIERDLVRGVAPRDLPPPDLDPRMRVRFHDDPKADAAARSALSAVRSVTSLSDSELPGTAASASGDAAEAGPAELPEREWQKRRLAAYALDDGDLIRRDRPI